QAMAPAGTLWAVDPYPTGRLGFSTQRVIAHRTVRPFDRGRVHWLRTTGREAAPLVGGPVDFLFIDGDHTYEGLRGDWEAWSGLIAVGGVVALHDSRSSPQRQIDHAGSVLYTQAVILRDPGFRVAEEVDSLTVLTRVT